MATAAANRQSTGPRKKKEAKTKEARQLKKTQAGTFNKFKTFEGKQYTGVKVGRGHKWHYDPGVWKEKKVSPDKWEFHYDVIKRRAGKAPEGSGAPVGTEYHWYILAHQTAKKLDANDYTTSMTGLKYKIAHKRFDREKWSAGERAQRKRLIKILEEMIRQLKMEPEEEGDKKTKEKANKVKKTKKKKPEPELVE